MDYPFESGSQVSLESIDANMHCDVDAVGESKQMEAFDWKHCHQPEGRCSCRHFSPLKNHAAVFRWLITLIEKTKGAHLWFDTMPICYAAIHTLMGIRGMHHVPCIASHTQK